MTTNNFKKSVSQETKSKISRALKGKKRGASVKGRVDSVRKNIPTIAGATATTVGTVLALKNRKFIGTTLSKVGMNVKGQMAKMATKGQGVAQKVRNEVDKRVLPNQIKGLEKQVAKQKKRNSKRNQQSKTMLQMLAK